MKTVGNTKAESERKERSEEQAGAGGNAKRGRAEAGGEHCARGKAGGGKRNAGRESGGCGGQSGGEKGIKKS